MDNVPSIQQLYQAPEEVLDRSHPVNDRYLRELEGIQQRLNEITDSLPTKKLAVFRLLDQNLTYTDIARQTKVGSATVSKLHKSQDYAVYHAVHTLYKQRKTLPTLLVRQQMLWRIAVDNEKKRPAISIAALKQLDAQEGVVALASTPQTQGISITIQNFQEAHDARMPSDATTSRFATYDHEPHQADDSLEQQNETVAEILSFDYPTDEDDKE